MSIFHRPTAPSEVLTPSVFDGKDVCAAAGLPLARNCPCPRFDDLLWDFTGVIGMPRYLARHARILAFAEIVNPRWRTLAKEFIFARLAPDHPAVRELPHAYRTPVQITTVNGRLDKLTDWLNWLTEQGVHSLGAVTQQHCDAYLELRKKVRDKHGIVVRDSSPSYRMDVVAVIQELGYYTELFAADGYPPSFRPWGRRTAYAVAGMVRQRGNKTRPLTNDVFQPLVAAALYVVEVLAPHLIDLQQQLQEMVPDPPGRNSERPTWQVEMVQAIDRHIVDGEPFDVALEHVVAQRLADGWSADDPLLNVNLISLAHETGRRAFHSPWLTTLRSRLEHAVAAVGLSKRWGRAAALVKRADGRGEVPWALPMNTTEARLQISRARTACVIALAALTGMRKSELAELTFDCRLPPEELGAGRLRYRLKGKIIKGKALGGQRDQWVTIKEAYDTAGVAADLAGPASGHLFKSMSFYTRYEWFLSWVNGPEGRRLGLAPIPEEPVNLRRLRRTLAVEMAHRPGGLLAAKIHLKHISVVTTEGYADRPGGAQTVLLAEFGKEEREHKTRVALDAFRDYHEGIRPAGPGAQDLIDFFEFVDGQLDSSGAPNSKRNDQEVTNLLAKRANALYLGVANYCWFLDPSKALCLKLAGRPVGEGAQPLIGMCDSARCPQATHHAGHRPVWAASAENKKVFIATIGRAQRTEKARLTTELARDERVLSEIDTAVAMGV
ncbi:site-specific integrase [Streptomyces scabiei]|uniref:site-specific integrase n=1 Tax=Streptomyces scabiei TaxID=1930 RepID=UPI001B331F96|nr:site-specific integrase [Streptomyces sp. LBUM 1488]MBP5898059.1 site-specific integrase [Streptomyces sp. LBUM 1488]